MTNTDTSRIADLRFQVSEKMPINHSDLSCLFDRIEALEAENERLEALFTNATYEARAMMEEIERLRAELSGWREMAGKAEQ